MGEERPRRVLGHYERQTEEEALAEEEAAFESSWHTVSKCRLISFRSPLVGLGLSAGL